MRRQRSETRLLFGFLSDSRWETVRVSSRKEITSLRDNAKFKTKVKIHENSRLHIQLLPKKFEGTKIHNNTYNKDHRSQHK